MKIYNLIIIAFVLILYACNTTENNYKGLETTTVNGVEIPIIRLDLAPDSAKIVNLSSIVDDIEIIPLETKKECMIGYAFPYFSEEYIFVWTQVWPRVYLYAFDREGNFVRKIGKEGKGPGEHTGNSVEVIHAYDNKRLLEVYFWGSLGEMPKLFDYNGNYIHDIKYPYKLMSNFNRYNDSVWFSLGTIAGNPHYKRDSVMLVFFDKNGNVIKEYPRLEYPDSRLGKYSPSGWMKSIYKYNDQWRFYNPGNDTLYNLNLDELTPIAIFHRGKNGSPYNQHITPTEIIGKYNFSILRETKEYMIINKSFITVAELNEYRPGQWGGMFDTSDFLIIIDKKNGEIHNFRIKDNILGFFPEKLLTQYSSEWKNGSFYFSLQAIDLKESISECLKKEDLPENARKRLMDLDNKLTDNSNPVIFKFKLKDKFDLK